MRRVYLWNTTAGVMLALQSVIMLMIIMRVCDAATAGIFTIAYASANLFLNMGKYGMRNYQSSDVSGRFSFGCYLRSRVVTTAAMVVSSAVYLAFSATTLDYSIEKTLVIAVVCLWKSIDSIEDVFMGNYQQNGRLDAAGLLLTLRFASGLLVFGLVACVTGSLLASLCACTAYSLVFCAGELIFARTHYGLPRDIVPGAIGIAATCGRGGCVADAEADGFAVGAAESRGDGDRETDVSGVLPNAAAHGAAGRSASIRGGAGEVFVLLKECFPLFLAAFLLFYIGNAPKYAIDACLGDVEQAYYGFIAMPVFVVSLLAGFVYGPLITPLSQQWTAGDARGFLLTFVKQIVIVFGITAMCDVGAWLLGVPVLGWMYDVDLSPYLVELLLLVSGGGFLALVSLFTMGITVLRRQSRLVWGYIAVGVLGFVASNSIVREWGITGAAGEYIALMGILALWFAVVFFASMCGEMRGGRQ